MFVGVVDCFRLSVTDCDTGTAWSLNVTPSAPKFLYCFRPFNILLSQSSHSVCTPVKVIKAAVCKSNTLPTRYNGAVRPTYETRMLVAKITCVGLNKCKNQYTCYFSITAKALNIVNTQHYLL